MIKNIARNRVSVLFFLVKACIMKEFLLYSEVNIVCIAVLAIIAFNIKNSEYSPGRRPRTLLKLIYSTIAFYILDIVGGFVRLDTPDPDPSLVYVLSAFYFLFFAISSYMWFFYSEILHNKAFFDEKGKHLLLALPLFVLGALLIVSYFTGWIFAVDAQTGYHSGPIFAIQAGLSFAYISVAGFRSAYFARKNRKSSTYRDLMTFSFYSFFALICEILQFVFGEFSLMVIGTTVSVLLLYLHYLRNMISLDPLTQISNRRKLLYEASDAARLLKPHEKLCFMFVDVDNFKLINDRCGHLEGDSILQAVSHVIRKFCKRYNCICGRYGGDEFAIIQVVSRDKEFKSSELLYGLIDEKNITTSDGRHVTVSIGYAELEPGDEISELVARADISMYEVKRAKKFGGGVTLCQETENQ